MNHIEIGAVAILHRYPERRIAVVYTHPNGFIAQVLKRDGRRDPAFTAIGYFADAKAAADAAALLSARTGVPLDQAVAAHDPREAIRDWRERYVHGFSYEKACRHRGLPFSNWDDLPDGAA